MNFQFEMTCSGHVTLCNVPPNNVDLYMSEGKLYTLYVEIYIGDIPVKVCQFDNCKRFFERKNEYCLDSECLAIFIPTKGESLIYKQIIPDSYYLNLKYYLNYTLLFPFNRVYPGCEDDEGFSGMKRLFIIEDNVIYVKLIYDASDINIQYIKNWI